MGKLNKLPIYEAVISDTDESGVEYVALVDKPAIKKFFIAFGDEQKQFQFAATDNEQRILSGPLLIPDTLIYRKGDSDLPEHYITYSSDTIRRTMYKFFRSGNTGNVNLMHDSEKKQPGVYMVESFLIDNSRGITAPEQFKDLPQGSWFASFKVDDDETWNAFIKSGELRGFSIEGVFGYKEKQSLESLIEEIQDIFAQID